MATAAVVASGAAFLIIQYLWRQSYWGDEVAILGNIRRDGFGQMFAGGLSHSQAAPPLFMAVEKVMWMAFGPGEYSERLLPVLMGIGAMAAFAGLARRVLPPWPAALAVALLCFSDRFLWHASEVKQYAGDVLCAVVLIWMAMGGKEEMNAEALRRGGKREEAEGISPRRFLWLSLCCGLLIWLSHPVVFVYAAVSAVMAGRLIRGRGRGIGAYLIANALFLVSFAALFWFSIRPQSADAYLQDFWRGSMVDWSRPLGIPLWLGRQLWSVGGYALAPVAVSEVLLCGLILLGAAAWVRRGEWGLVGLCLGPVAWVIVAAGVGAYPLSGARVDFFLAPGLLIAACEGVAAAAAVLRGRAWVAAMVCVLVGPMIWMDVTALFWPRVRMNVRPLAEALRRRRLEDEPIYTGACGEVLSWYWPTMGGDVSTGVPVEATGAKTFWYVTAGKPENLLKEEAGNLGRIDRHAKEIGGDRISVRGGVAVHFIED